MPMVSYCRWILSARSSKRRTMDDFSRYMDGLMPERTMAGHVRAMQSQYCRLARQIPERFPNRQYKAPWRIVRDPRRWKGKSILKLSEKKNIYICKLCETYFKLLLRDVCALWVQVIQNSWYYVSTAEVIGCKSREQHTLSSASHLKCKRYC